MSKLTIGKKFFHSDDSHGWLAVKRSELDALGIADKVSSYSYVLGKTVYLEEDVDAPLFVKAARAATGKDVDIKRAKHWKRSNIRGFQSYKVS